MRTSDVAAPPSVCPNWLGVWEAADVFYTTDTALQRCYGDYHPVEWELTGSGFILAAQLRDERVTDERIIC